MAVTKLLAYMALTIVTIFITTEIIDYWRVTPLDHHLTTAALFIFHVMIVGLLLYCFKSIHYSKL